VNEDVIERAVNMHQNEPSEAQNHVHSFVQRLEAFPSLYEDLVDDLTIAWLIESSVRGREIHRR
jgi:hypothetical protein